jgi:anti-sigma regulatory factor (Ser/Thr protein kinase)
MTVETRRTIRIPAELDRVADVRQLVRDVAGICHAPEPCMDDLVQAVDEATTNVIVHGYRGQPGWVDVAAERVGDRIVVTVTDEAPTFDPTTVPDPDLSVPPHHRRPGGMGVHLIREATDRLEHEPRPGGGNILTLDRRLDPRPKEERT